MQRNGEAELALARAAALFLPAYFSARLISWYWLSVGWKAAVLAKGNWPGRNSQSRVELLFIHCKSYINQVSAELCLGYECCLPVLNRRVQSVFGSFQLGEICFSVLLHITNADVLVLGGNLTTVVLLILNHHKTIFLFQLHFWIYQVSLNDYANWQHGRYLKQQAPPASSRS